jgi:CRP-like cAMP-binding protein
MKPDLSEVPAAKNRDAIARWNAAAIYRRDEERAQGKEDRMMLVEARSRDMEAVAAHPVSELLACPPAIGNLLTASARTISFESGQVIFRQITPCAGLYLVVQGQLQRRTERLDIRVILGQARPGDLVELAASLGDHLHTYSLVAQTSGSLLMLPLAALQKAFENYPPLQMQLLEELAREVSRAYRACSLARCARGRRARASTGN